MNSNLKINTPVSVVINVYNESETIESEIRNIHDLIVSKIPGSEFIVAEDGSNDGTKEIISLLVKELGIIHSTSEERKGYKKALKDAFLITKNPLIFFSDTGNKHDPSEFWDMYEYSKEFDIVIGVKTNRQDQYYRRLLTLGYNYLISALFKTKVQDADSGFRIYKKDLITKLLEKQWTFDELISSELTLRSILEGFKLKEIPVSYKQRASESRGLPLKKIPRVIFNNIFDLISLSKEYKDSIH